MTKPSSASRRGRSTNHPTGDPVPPAKLTSRRLSGRPHCPRGTHNKWPNGAGAAAVIVAGLAVLAGCGGNRGAATSTPASQVITSPTTQGSGDPVTISITRSVESPSPVAGATAVTASTPMTTPATSPLARTGPDGPGSVSTAAVLPAPLTFSHRIGFVGGRSTLFKIALSGAEVAVDGNLLTAVVHAKVTNFSIADQFISYVKTPSLLLPDGTLLPMNYRTSTLIPGGGTTPLDLVARLSEPSTFTFAGASLVFGNNASAQTIIPLDDSSAVSTFMPVVDTGKGVSADSGAGTKSRITGTILHADYDDGAKATLQLEVALDVSFSDTPKIQDIFSITLTTPDGTSAAPATSVLFGRPPNSIVLAGRTVHGGLLFDIPAAYAGSYALTIHSDRVKDAAGSGAVDPVLKFTIPHGP